MPSKTQGEFSACFFAVIVLLSAISGSAQAVSNMSAPPPSEFEAASIRSSTSKAPLGSMARDGKLVANGITAKALVALAYGVRDAEVTGGPEWIGSDRFDVNAKSEVRINLDRMRPMIQRLLADRFGLKVHRETREMQVYALLVSKKGAKLTTSNDVNCTDPNTNASPPPLPVPGQPFKPVGLRCGGFYVLNGHLEARKVSIQELAQTLSRMNVLERPVLDQTGITGTFDINLQWSPDPQPGGPQNSASPVGPRQAVPAPDFSGPSIFSSFRETLGLELESRKGLVEVLVIDDIGKPSPN